MVYVTQLGMTVKDPAERGFKMAAEESSKHEMDYMVTKYSTGCSSRFGCKLPITWFFVLPGFNSRAEKNHPFLSFPSPHHVPFIVCRVFPPGF